MLEGILAGGAIGAVIGAACAVAAFLRRPN
jgi:gas vesicle protein